MTRFRDYFRGVAGQCRALVEEGRLEEAADAFFDGRFMDADSWPSAPESIRQQAVGFFDEIHEAVVVDHDRAKALAAINEFEAWLRNLGV